MQGTKEQLSSMEEEKESMKEAKMKKTTKVVGGKKKEKESRVRRKRTADEMLGIDFPEKDSDESPIGAEENQGSDENQIRKSKRTSGKSVNYKGMMEEESSMSTDEQMNDEGDSSDKESVHEVATSSSYSKSPGKRGRKPKWDSTVRGRPSNISRETIIMPLEIGMEPQDLPQIQRFRKWDES